MCVCVRVCACVMVFVYVCVNARMYVCALACRGVLFVVRTLELRSLDDI